jgi:hypothetical protein
MGSSRGKSGCRVGGWATEGLQAHSPSQKVSVTWHIFHACQQSRGQGAGIVPAFQQSRGQWVRPCHRCIRQVAREDPIGVLTFVIILVCFGGPVRPVARLLGRTQSGSSLSSSSCISASAVPLVCHGHICQVAREDPIGVLTSVIILQICFGGLVRPVAKLLGRTQSGSSLSS